MRQVLQATIQKPIEIEGISIETGRESRWILYPAEVDQGITFVRETENRQTIRIKAHYNNVYHTNGYVRLGHYVGVHGVEHFLSAIHGVGITNAEVFCPSEYPPENTVLLTNLLYENKKIQSREVDYHKFPVQIFHYNGKAIQVDDSEDLKISCFFDFNSPVTPDRLKYSVVVTPESYRDKICKARTFCTHLYLTTIQKRNRALGVNENNCIVLPDSLDEEFNVNVTELAIHKVLDFIGDIFLVGKPVKGDFTLFNPSHSISYIMNMRNGEDAELPKEKN